jgi:hypothetical protein
LPLPLSLPSQCNPSLQSTGFSLETVKNLAHHGDVTPSLFFFVSVLEVREKSFADQRCSVQAKCSLLALVNLLLEKP